MVAKEGVSSPSSGLWLCRHTKDIDAAIDWTGHVIDAVVKGVEAIAGRAAADCVATKGVGTLHTMIDARDVGRLRDHVIEQLRSEFLNLAVRVGRNVLEWRDEFYVDDYLILRINFPYEIARRADPTAENPGIGRVSPSVRATARARRVTDPVFDPKGYHKDHPPAAWAHGPHRDSWTGHSRDGINIWWAISEVPAHAGMILYEGLDEVALPSDPRSGYLRSGYPLPKPVYAPLASGEMLVFDPEILHGTHLNLTDQTRVAVSMRLNASKPKFDPSCFYAREFWRRATAIEAGEFEEVLHFKREDNLAANIATLPIAPTPRTSPIVVDIPSQDVPVIVGPSSLIEDGQRCVVAISSRSVTIVRVNGVLRAFDSVCPHYGVDLSDGAFENATLHCPGCGVGFDARNGQCRSRALKLRSVDVSERDGLIQLAVPPEIGRTLAP